MARFPGTERHGNRAGLQPGDGVRCRRSRANADLGLADRRGVVGEVRLDNVRVLFDAQGAGAWLPNDSLVREDAGGPADLALLGQVLRLLRAERVEHDEGELIVIGGEIPVGALDELRALLGGRLLSCSLRPEGVHQIGTRLRLAPAGDS